MGLEKLPEQDAHYHLVSYDARGQERDERGEPYSATVLREAASAQPSDVIVFSHGWQGDVPAARQQYGRWIATMLAETPARQRLGERPGGFHPLLVGLHWPSKAWGDEELGSSSFAVPAAAVPSAASVTAVPATPAAEGPAGSAGSVGSVGSVGSAGSAGELDAVEQLVRGYAERLGDSPVLREAVRTVVLSALEDAAPTRLPEPVRRAYDTINAETGLGESGDGAAPGDDRMPFDPDAAYLACQLEEAVAYGGLSLGGLLAPLRLLTFWQMKKRARTVGESGAAALLVGLRRAAAEARLHLMGHSFGCIVASAAISGPVGGTAAAPVASLALVQGAMSLWSFSDSLPTRPNRPGYFRRLVADQLVSGPTLVTTSPHDRAVRTFYPIGAGLGTQVDYAPGELPAFGGIGTWGVRGSGVDVVDQVLPATGGALDLQPGAVTNLDAAAVIRNGSGPSGAHNDICHSALAQAVWQAIATEPRPP